MSLLVAVIQTELASGRFPAPAWAILALGAVVVVGAGIYLGLRARGGRNSDGEGPR